MGETHDDSLARVTARPARRAAAMARAVTVLGAVLALAAEAAPRPAAGKAPPAKPAVPVPAERSAAGTRESGGDETPVPGGEKPRSHLTLEGGADGTVFRTLTIEGEDRIHLEIQRPTLRLDLDPASAPGLELGGAEDVMNRTRPDLSRALLDAVPADPSERAGRPWLESFATGPVARFRPELTDVETWSLTVNDARGRTAARFEGKGTPPKEIAWDGRAEGGAGAMPGLTYSYVLEARDRAGNRRHFVGDGFEVPAYREMAGNSMSLAFPGDALAGNAGASAAASRTQDPLLAEAATWVNQLPVAAPVEIVATARTHARGDALARAVHAGMRPFLVGDPARVRERVVVETDAPGEGTVRIQAGR
jgi:hypothetical protein